MKAKPTYFRALPMLVFVGTSLTAALFNGTLNAWQGEPNPEAESRFLSNIQQLTMEGRRAGEGYFSSDGKKLVFQSERVEGNPFFQMFVMDLELGDVVQVSPGHGKTTCGWIHPDGRKVLFASTQHDPEAKAKQKQELELREQGRQRRYSWDYDENYDLYTYDLETRQYARLTEARGYDAEGSFSPDGKLIAFASNRNAYSGRMTAKQREKFETHKAFMMDIFIMNSDGSDVRQLTDVDGYDGGPFFSPDGKRICWRRFDENEVTAEIMTMNIDGTDVKQLTRMRCSSFAPFYHPSGKYLVFNNNKHGFGNFELYLVDVEGHSPPVRVTSTDGFDGLASFSPDGKQIYWTSTRHNVKGRTGQIFRADWNHDYALQALGLDGSAPVDEINARQWGADSAAATDEGFTDRDIMRHVDYLCRRELGGRLTGTVGERKATAYVAAYLENLGIQPAGDNGSWYQTFSFPDGAELGPGNKLTLSRTMENSASSEDYTLQQQWQPLTFSGIGKNFEGPIVFAGYGIDADQDNGQEAYDSYEQLDVKGKWVMVLRYWPEDVSPERLQHLQFHSKLRKKAMVARDNGAVGIIIVSGPRSNVREQLVPLENDFSQSGSSIAAISINDDVAAAWLKQAGQDLQHLQEQLDAGEMLPGFEIPGLSLAATIEIEQRSGRGRNVIGRLQAGDQPSDQAILVGAHIDHLGRGRAGSLARNEEKNQIHVGADDNASGVAAVLEIAEFLAGLKREGKLDLQRDVVFAAWSGEEIGLHGSQHFVSQSFPSNGRSSQMVEGNDLQPYQGDPHDLEALLVYYQDFLEQFDATRATTTQLQLLRSNMADMKMVSKLLQSSAANTANVEQNQKHLQEIAPLLSRAKTLVEQADDMTIDPDRKSLADSRPIVACLNMDMVGRMNKQLVLQGLGSSNDWNRIIEKANVVVGLPVKLSDDTQLPTDASSFYRAGVPILSAFTGSHADYHTPRDTPEKLNYPDAARIARLMGLITRQLAMADSAPGYVKQTPKSSRRIAPAGRRARLGSVPNYTEKVDGVLLDDVSVDGPAEKAGIRRGDIIIGLAGKKIENIYDYQYAIDSLKVGKPTEIVVRRGDQVLKLEIVPGSRD